MKLTVVLTKFVSNSHLHDIAGIYREGQRGTDIRHKFMRSFNNKHGGKYFLETKDYEVDISPLDTGVRLAVLTNKKGFLKKILAIFPKGIPGLKQLKELDLPPDVKLWQYPLDSPTG